MDVWWNSLVILQQVMFIIGCAMGIVLIVQIVMMLIGSIDDVSFDADTDLDFDADVDPFNESGGGVSIFGLRVLSVRSVISFLALGSWVVYTLLFTDVPDWVAILIGIVAGVGAAFITALLVRFVEKAQSSGNINIHNAVGKVGEVYLIIPKKRSGNGKVNVYIQERYSEFDAVTDNIEDIKTGATIKIVGVLNENILVVEPF